MNAEERTFVALKPDAVKRGLIGEILLRFERKGYKIIGLKLLNVTEEMAAKHYEEHYGKPFYKRLITYITSGPVVAMVVKGYDAIHGVRQILGTTNPSNADVGTIRADFAQLMEFNVIHGSDSTQSAEREIAIYFSPDEICDQWENMCELVVNEVQSLL